MKVSLLPLNELYAREKITASVEAAIHEKEDFSKISKDYCEKVCKLKCKAYEQIRLAQNELDIMIIQDHATPNGKWDRFDGQQEKIQQDVIFHLCKQAGFGDLKYRVVNLLKCSPSDVDFPNGKAPTATTLLKCKPYLLDEIRRCKPKVIISLSTVVTKALGLIKHSNTGDRGKIVQSDYGQVVISLHPRILSMVRQTAKGSSGFWSADYYHVIKRDFEKAKLLATNQLIVPTLESALEKTLSENIVICRSLQEVEKECSEILALPESSIVSWDIETTGLDGWSKDAKVITTQFGYRVPNTTHYKSVVFPLFHKENTWFDPVEAWKLITPILTGKTKKIGWNIMFDLVYTYACTGIKAQNIAFDGMLCNHLMDSGATGTMSLKAAVCDWLPETGLQGYEDRLPPLTKSRSSGEEIDEEETT